MADIYTISTPRITSAAFSVNPCSINERIVITVLVSEDTVKLEASTIYAGEIYAGER